jgi:hypothetical protein
VSITVQGTSDPDATARAVVNRINSLQSTDYNDRFARGMRYDKAVSRR